MLIHRTGRARCKRPESEDLSEGSPAMRLTGVRGQGQGRGGPAQVPRMQSGVVLQQGARRAAQAGARELVQRADFYLRPLDVQKASRSRRQVPPV
jgi:hypothetical protein